METPAYRRFSDAGPKDYSKSGSSFKRILAVGVLEMWVCEEMKMESFEPEGMKRVVDATLAY